MTKSKKPEFRPNDFVVYPAHGVGKIISIEEQEIAGIQLELFVISFEKDKMTLRVPTHKATDIGMRAAVGPRCGDQGAGHAEGQGQGQARDVVAPGAGI
jgi:CarD family transcriptional regulator